MIFMKIIVFFVLQEIFLNLIKSVETLHRYVSNEYLWSMITKRRTSQKCIVQLIVFNWQNQILNALEYYINLLQSHPPHLSPHFFVTYHKKNTDKTTRNPQFRWKCISKRKLCKFNAAISRGKSWIVLKKKNWIYVYDIRTIRWPGRVQRVETIPTKQRLRWRRGIT